MEGLLPSVHYLLDSSLTPLSPSFTVEYSVCFSLIEVVVSPLGMLVA